MDIALTVRPRGREPAPPARGFVVTRSRNWLTTAPSQLATGFCAFRFAGGRAIDAKRRHSAEYRRCSGLKNSSRGLNIRILSGH
jgi:hypothetical protein